MSILIVVWQFSLFGAASQEDNGKTFNGKIFEEHLQIIKNLDKSNPKLIIMFSGTPGMGKTFLAKKLEEQFHGLRISSDEVRSIFNMKKIKDKGKDQKLLNDYLLWSVKRLNNLSPNHLIILDRSIDRTGDMYYQFAKNFGYDVFLIRLKVDRDVVEKRIKERGTSVDNLIEGSQRWWELYERSAQLYPADYQYHNHKHDKKHFRELTAEIEARLNKPGILSKIKPGTQEYNNIRKEILDDFPASPEMQEIIPGLYLGNEAAASHLPLNFTNVLCFRTELQKNPSNRMIWKGIQIPDKAGAHMLPYFQESYEFLESAKGDTLVHCRYGRSRSPVVVIAYLMKKFDVPFDKAYRFVRLKRPTIEPNSGFIEELKVYERILRDQK
ncbi:MAG: dual specificity protein phosphatase family protein [Chlamydiales bacterium]